MKKLGILLMTFLFSFSIIHGQQQKSGEDQPVESKKESKKERVALRKLEGNNVSEEAKSSFNADFGNMPNVSWKRIENFDEASFTKDSKVMRAFYDPTGKLVGTSTIVTFADLPKKGQEEIKKQYKDYTIGQVIYYDNNEFSESDMMLYGVQFENEDNYFVELAKAPRTIVIQVSPLGELFFFKEM